MLLLVAALAAAATALWPRDEPRRPADPCGPVDRTPLAAGIEAAGAATVCLVNRERTSRGLPALRLHPLLTQASAAHSRDMVERRYFEHDSPDGRSVGDRLRDIGYARGRSVSTGENIAYGVGGKATPRSIVEAWMRSPGHRADILRPAFTEIGIGVALGLPRPPGGDEADSATYTTDFGGVVDPALPSD